MFLQVPQKEEVNRKTYHSLQELRLSVFEYIEGFYNAKRPHSSLGMMTPNEKKNGTGHSTKQLYSALSL